MTSLALLAGVGFGLGVLCLVAGLMRRESGSDEGSPPPTKAMLRRLRPGSGALPATYRRLGVALAVAVVVGAFTRWPVGGVLAGVLAGSWHALFGHKAASAAEVARIEAIASWTEMLRDALVAAAGLEGAIVATAPLAPAPIRSEVAALAGRLEAREVTLATGLGELAAALADPTADLVVAALASAATRRVRNLGELLGALATSARERQHAHARRRRPGRVRTSARVVTGFTVAMAGGLVALKRDFLEPYGGLTGQLVLVLVGAAFAVAFWWLSRMSRMDVPERFLADQDGLATTGVATAELRP